MTRERRLQELEKRPPRRKRSINEYTEAELNRMIGFPPGYVPSEAELEALIAEGKRALAEMEAEEASRQEAS